MGRNPTLLKAGFITPSLSCPNPWVSISHHVLWLCVYIVLPIWLGASWRQGWWFIDLCSSELHSADIQYIFEWISEWANECLSLFCVPLSRYIRLGHSDWVEAKLSSEYLSHVIPSKGSGGCKRINVEWLRDTSPPRSWHPAYRHLQCLSLWPFIKPVQIMGKLNSSWLALNFFLFEICKFSCSCPHVGQSSLLCWKQACPPMPQHTPTPAFLLAFLEYCNT